VLGAKVINLCLLSGLKLGMSKFWKSQELCLSWRFRSFKKVRFSCFINKKD